MDVGSLISLVDKVLGPAIPIIHSFAWIGIESHILKLSWLDAKIEPLAEMLQMGLPLVKYTLSLFLVYPAGLLLRLCPNTNLKHFLSMLGGLFLSQWIFGASWIHFVISSAVTYLLCIIMPRKILPQIVVLWALGYMVACHMYSMYATWDIPYFEKPFDFTGTQMVLTMKLTSFAYNLYDGTADKKNVNSVYDDKKKNKVYGPRKTYAIDSLPNPLEFFGYIFCFTCILAGPAFEYKEYVGAIDGTIYNCPKKRNKISVWASLLPGLKRGLVGVIALVLHLVVSGHFPMKQVIDSEFISKFGFFYRYGSLWIALSAERMKYYFAWKIAEGASVLAGFGFQGYKKKDDDSYEVVGWEGVQNISISGFEFSTNVQTLSRSWNQRTQGWLERYFYNRSGCSLLYTYFCSAIWHGVYPGFFVFFMSVPLMTAIERLCKLKLNPYFAPGYDGYNDSTYPNTPMATIYWYICLANNTICMNYLVQTFCLGTWMNVNKALGSFHYIGHIAFLSVYIILKFLPTKKEKLK